MGKTKIVFLLSPADGMTYSSYFKKRYIPQPQYAGLWSVTTLFSVNKRPLFDQVATGQLVF